MVYKKIDEFFKGTRAADPLRMPVLPLSKDGIGNSDELFLFTLGPDVEVSQKLINETLSNTSFQRRNTLVNLDTDSARTLLGGHGG